MQLERSRLYFLQRVGLEVATMVFEIVIGDFLV